MPQMALLTGGLDDLGCFLTRMGIDPTEYAAPHSGGRLDIYQGLSLAGNGPGLSNGTAGNCTNTSCPLWASKQSFEKYDIVLLACEGDTFDSDAQTDGGGGLNIFNASNVTATGKQSLHDWLDEGGKVFATHFHYTWFMNGPADFKAVANWKGYSLGTGTCNNCAIDQTFQGGKDFYSWLQTAGALSGTGINLTGVADSVSTVTAGTTDRVDLQPEPARHRGRQVPLVQHAHRRYPRRRGPRGGRQAVLRQGRLHRPPRGRRAVGRHPRVLQGAGPHRAGEGPRVPLLRPLGLREEQESGAFPSPTQPPN